MVTKRFPLSFVLLAAPLAAQFSSGSNGSDGALNLQVLQGQTTRTVEFDPDDTTLFPPNGLNPARNNIFHFTTITIGPGVTVRMRSPRVRDLPVVWLASGAVLIQGAIDLTGGPGHPSSSNMQVRDAVRPRPRRIPRGCGRRDRSRSDAGRRTCSDPSA
ncbi:MAG TPA: hypothetical protein DEH78_16605, partial [Solibacterales bacterium]|nr:hypothetical protein [Bryobacterales bacterium]